jgi:DNA polymerase-3 subunit delta
MAEQTFEHIIRDLKNNTYQPVYFLTGEEPYYIDILSGYIQDNALNESEKTFNQSVLYGKETEVAMILDAAKRFPMMASRQVVIVKEAQEMKKLEELAHYIEHPLQSTILVINHKYKTPDKRKKFGKLLKEKTVYFESKKVYDDKLPGWITDHVASKDHSIDPKGAALLAEFLGSDLSKISNEVDKLIITLGEKQKKITPAHIERNIGISKDFNNFELQKALGTKNILKANRIINYFADNQKNYPVVQTISTLYFFFSKLLIYYWIKDKSKENVASVLKVHPFFVAEYAAAARLYNANKVIQIISHLREYDLKSKGYQGYTIPPRDLLKELIYKILH